MTTDSSFNIPEPPSGIGTGLLTELWRTEEQLPKTSGVALVWYYCRRGVETLTSLPMSSIITIMTIAISLFLFAGFLLLLQNVERIISDAGGSMLVTAYLKEGISDTQLTDFLRELEASKEMKSVTYVSKEDALATFRRELGARGSFLEGLDQNNPLPASVDLELHPDELKIGSISQVLERLRKHPLIDEVIYGTEWVERIQRMLRAFRLLGFVLLFVVLIVIVFLIANTIKLVIFARRDEIAIMQLVGATWSFVCLPFIIGGVIQGLIGSVMGLLFLKAGFMLLTYEAKYSVLFGTVLPKVIFLGPLAVTMIIVFGMIVGAVGSFFALGRFMNV